MINVVGNIEDVQSSIDLYLGVTSVNCNTNSSSLRKKFFSMFEAEDKDREENFLSYQEEITEDYKISYTKKLILLDNEEIFDNNVSYFDVSLGRVVTNEDLFVQGVTLEKPTIVSTSAVTVQNQHEDYPVDEEVYSNEEDIESLIASSQMEEFDNSDDSIDEKFQEIDSTDGEDDFVTENYEEVEDDFVTESYEEVEDPDDNEDNSDDFSNWGNFSSEEDIEETLEDEDNFKNWGSDDSDVVSEDIQETEGVDDTLNSWGSFDEDITEENVEEKVDDFEDDLFDDLGECPSTLSMEEVTKPVETKNIVVEHETESKQSTMNEVPRDLREFIKLNPNCDISFALQYFTKKEIDKQLSLGRVFKRKNKLLI